MADEPEEQLAEAAEAAAAPEDGAGDAGWENGSEGGGGLVAAERILNQDEIDSLLGFDLSDDDASRAGVAQRSNARRSRSCAAFERRARLLDDGRVDFS